MRVNAPVQLPVTTAADPVAGAPTAAVTATAIAVFFMFIVNSRIPMFTVMSLQFLVF
jgi:hypothetical protein